MFVVTYSRFSGLNPVYSFTTVKVVSPNKEFAEKTMILEFLKKIEEKKEKYKTSGLDFGLFPSTVDEVYKLFSETVKSIPDDIDIDVDRMEEDNTFTLSITESSRRADSTRYLEDRFTISNVPVSSDDKKDTEERKKSQLP